ncbi:thioredoxin [Intestinibacillus sp. Marseille-P6563]|uniref:thioredoxin n=1 Tax=Intestinibacillus sp. Marseille-P6563 TaxID=2364792 RepID=UPI000F04F41B|nr:thioredoxin [Intestinibacillus sp. Marseille-P6563]
MSVLHITKNNFQSEVLESDRPVLIDFWASWCGPCRMVAPIIEEIAAENDRFKVGKIDVDAEPELAAQFRIMSIPTLIVMQGGKVVNQAIGARGKDDILSLIP